MKSFHLIRLDAQKVRQGSRTMNFRSCHRIRILLWSDNKLEEGLNNKSTLIFSSIHILSAIPWDIAKYRSFPFNYRREHRDNRKIR